MSHAGRTDPEGVAKLAEEQKSKPAKPEPKPEPKTKKASAKRRGSSDDE